MTSARQLFRLQLFGRPQLQLVALDDGELAATGGARGSMRLAIFSKRVLATAALDAGGGDRGYKRARHR